MTAPIEELRAKVALSCRILSSRLIMREDVLPGLAADLTVVHAEHDALGTAGWAGRLADLGGGRMLVAPDAPHSWPYRDTTAFADVVDRLVA